MYDQYCIQIVCTSSQNHKSETVTIKSSEINQVNGIIDLGIRHAEQIEILSKIQDQILKLQSPQLREKIDSCPECGSKLKRNGYTNSEFHSVFTDHKVSAIRQRCCNKDCNWSSVPSMRSLFGTSTHPDLAKLQCEVGSDHTYREAQTILNKQSSKIRKINNHESVHHMVESVGQYISDTTGSELLPEIPAAEELIVQVDGGHIKDKSPDKRSFEAMTAVFYQPGNIIYSIKAKDHRGVILNKSCAASAYNDEQKHMKMAALNAAKKQGLSKSTTLTALCDGASNCWSIVESLVPYCGAITRILDWFHISMKFKNIAIPEGQKEQYEKAKWSLWHGSVDNSIDRLNKIKEVLDTSTQLERLEKLISYITNNRKYILSYEKRKNSDKIFTSHMAESTVESLINKRCKGQQHMRWTREGVHPLLQIRCYIASNDWESHWEEKVLGAMKKAA